MGEVEGVGVHSRAEGTEEGGAELADEAGGEGRAEVQEGVEAIVGEGEDSASFCQTYLHRRFGPLFFII